MTGYGVVCYQHELVDGGILLRGLHGNARPHLPYTEEPTRAGQTTYSSRIKAVLPACLERGGD